VECFKERLKARSNRASKSILKKFLVIYFSASAALFTPVVLSFAGFACEHFPHPHDP
jgi:hypothetical protein